MIEKAIEQLKIDEGFKGVPYLCTANKVTIGYGRNLSDNPLTEKEAEYLLLSDLTKVEAEANMIAYFSELNETRQAVIINMIYNLGITRLLKFKKMHKAIVNGKFNTAATEMLDSKWARQVGNRANRLAKQMREGQ